MLDPACGTGGFLVEAYTHLAAQCRTADDRQTLEHSILGNEAKTLPYLLAEMNLLLHGMESPSIIYGNSLAQPLTGIGDAERVDVILTNPPFGGEEERGILGNFPEDKQTSETALLFLQLLMRKLRRVGRDSERGGRAAVVVPNGALFGDGVAARIKEELLKDFNLHTIVRLPNGVFAPYTSIPTNLLSSSAPAPRGRSGIRAAAAGGPQELHQDPAAALRGIPPLLAWWGDREENSQAWQVAVVDVLKYDGRGRLSP